MPKILRKLEDEDVEAILEEVALPASCDLATLKEDINELVALSPHPRRSATEIIEIIDQILGSLEASRNVLERHKRSEFLLPSTTLSDALRELIVLDLPETARSWQHPKVRNSPTFGDQLKQLIDHYKLLRTEWEAVKDGKRHADTSRDISFWACASSSNAVSINARLVLMEVRSVDFSRQS